MDFPDFLTDKQFGLPRWAWLAIIAGGITVGIVLRKRSANKDNEISDTPDDGYVDDSASTDESLNYAQDPSLYAGDAGTGYADGYYYDASGNPVGAAGSGGTIINIGASTLPSPLDPDGTAVPNPGAPAAPAAPKTCKDAKPTAPKGYHYACISNRWTLVANSRNDTSPSGGGGHTGGGPPNKPGDKAPGHIATITGGSIVTHPQGGGTTGLATAHPATPAARGSSRATNTGRKCNTKKPTADAGWEVYCGPGNNWWRRPR